MNSKIVRWHCPNCGELLSALKTDDGLARSICPLCRAAMVMKRKGRRKQILETDAPYGTECLYDREAEN